MEDTLCARYGWKISDIYNQPSKRIKLLLTLISERNKVEKEQNEKQKRDMRRN